MKIMAQAFQALALVTLPLTMTIAMEEDSSLKGEKSASSKKITTSFTGEFSSDLEEEDDSLETKDSSSSKKKRIYDLAEIKTHAERALNTINRSKTRFTPESIDQKNAYLVVSQLCEAWNGKGMEWLAQNSKYSYIKAMAQSLENSQEDDLLGQIKGYMESHKLTPKDEAAKVLPEALKYIETKLKPERKS